MPIVTYIKCGAVIIVVAMTPEIAKTSFIDVLINSRHGPGLTGTVRGTAQGAVCILIVILFDNQRFVRGFIGDIVVMGIVYCGLAVCLKRNARSIAIVALLIAYGIEIIQGTKLIHKLGLADNRLAVIIFGSTFDWFDLLAGYLR